MAGTGHEDDFEVPFLDEAVQVDIDEIEARRRAEMAEEARLDVRRL
jgi:hypothetical protein